MIESKVNNTITEKLEKNSTLMNENEILRSTIKPTLNLTVLSKTSDYINSENKEMQTTNSERQSVFSIR